MSPAEIGRNRDHGVECRGKLSFDDIQIKAGQKNFQRLYLPVFIEDDDLAQGFFIGGIGYMTEVGGRPQQAGAAGLDSRRNEFAAEAALVLRGRHNFLPAVPADHFFFGSDQVQSA
jgi:hypothetical protein